jgi:hypothetical protein
VRTPEVPENYKTSIISNQNLTVAATAASSSKDALVHTEIAMLEWSVFAGGASIAHL